MHVSCSSLTLPDCVTTQMVGVLSWYSSSLCICPLCNLGGSHTFIETLYEQKKEHRTCVMITTSDVSEGKLKHALQKTPTKLRAEMETKQRFVKKRVSP